MYSCALVIGLGVGLVQFLQVQVLVLLHNIASAIPKDIGTGIAIFFEICIGIGIVNTV